MQFDPGQLEFDRVLTLIALEAKTAPGTDALLARRPLASLEQCEEAPAKLRAIRNRVHQKRSAIQKLLTDVMNRNADAIQEPLIVLRGDRYCIPVRSDHRNAVTGILHERSGSGASFFIEPMQAVELNNDLADLLIQEREEIARITRFIAQLLVENERDLVDSIAVAAEFEIGRAHV